ncbi:MAG: alpha/beta hydrolase [Bacillota bacterium]|nr:alpha/beta hydrolase [Bacillota bacterium]
MKAIEYGKENKDCLLFLHGGGLSWWNYKEVAELLSSRFHIVIPILNGHGGSGIPFTSIEENAKEIISYIDAHFGGQVLLIGGLSLGGQILLEMLSQRSNICSFAMIESALALPLKPATAFMKPAYAICYPLIKKRWFAKLQFRALHIKAGHFEAYYTDSAALSRQDLLAFSIANSNYRLKDTLAACKAKALILAGGRESAIMKKSARIIAGLLPAARLELMKNYFHGELSLNHPEEYTEKLLQLISPGTPVEQTGRASSPVEHAAPGFAAHCN